MNNGANGRRPSVAVVGAGYWGKNLVRNFHQIGALKVICDKNETTLAALQSQYSGVEVCYALADVPSARISMAWSSRRRRKPILFWRARPFSPESTYLLKSLSP